MKEKLIKLLSDAHSISAEAACFDDATYAKQLRMEADHLIANGVTIPVLCKDCEYWAYKDEDFGDCTHRRFHLDGHADPTMHLNDFCSCGERRCRDAMQDQGDQGFNRDLP